MKTDFKALLGDIPKKSFIYILGAIGILMVLASAFTDNPTESSNEEVLPDYCALLEARLDKMLPEISGVGSVKVMITAENFGKIRLATKGSDNGDETIVLSQKGGGEDIKVVEETYPEIKGVVIAADGGGNPKVKEALTEAIEALLGVDAHKIKVFERTVK